MSEPLQKGGGDCVSRLGMATVTRKYVGVSIFQRLSQKSFMKLFQKVCVFCLKHMTK